MPHHILSLKHIKTHEEESGDRHGPGAGSGCTGSLVTGGV